MNIVLDRNNLPFIDRDGEYFSYILDYLRDDELIIPEDEQEELILEEFKFYGLESKPKLKWEIRDIHSKKAKVGKDGLTLSS